MENKKMLSNGIVYFCSSIITQFINLFLIPLYTRNLTQQQFGQYDIIISIQQLLALAITLGVYSGMVRFFNEYEDRKELKNTAVTFSLLWGSLCIAIAWAVNPWVYPLLFGKVHHANLFIPYIVMSSVFACINLIYSSYYSMLFKGLKSASIQISTILCTFLYALYFFLVLKMGIIGILQAQLFANLTVFAVLFLFHIRSYRPKIKFSQLKVILNYGTGLLLGDISSWVLSLSDRFLIKGFMNLSSVAVYSIGYKIGMLINPVFINPFMSVFTPFKYALYKETNGPEWIVKMFRMYNFAGWLCVLGLSIFANIAIDLVATEAYRSAVYVIPLIALSYFLSGTIAFYGLGLHIAKKMKIYSSIIIASAIINVGCNMLLIPKLGIYGSALSTCVAYAISNVLFYYFGSKYYKLRLSLFYPYKYLAIFIPIYGIYFAYMKIIHSVLLEIAFNGILCVSFVILSLVCRFISKRELAGVLHQVFKRNSKISYKGVQSEL